MSELKATEEVLVATTLVDKMTKFESEHRPFINLFIRPMLMLIVFLAVGYYTMWMSTNYVKQEKFTAILEKQNATDKQQDETAKARFEVIQTKLDTVINNQTAFIEQLKSYNQLMTAYQKQMDSMNDRVIYLERYHKGNQQ
jgi:hypothetical protein